MGVPPGVPKFFGCASVPPDADAVGPLETARSIRVLEIGDSKTEIAVYILLEVAEGNAR
jgi:hypothetical protein